MIYLMSATRQQLQQKPDMLSEEADRIGSRLRKKPKQMKCAMTCVTNKSGRLRHRVSVCVI